jgi:hypothetical protein
MPPRRLLFFPDYLADPIWDGEQGGMISLDDLPLSSETRTETREWAQRWEHLAYAEQEAEAFSGGMSEQPAEPVAREVWLALEGEGRKLWRRLQTELGDRYQLEWAY